LKCALQPIIAKQLLKTPILGVQGCSRSFKVIDVDKSKKPVTSACYDKQHVYTYLQPFSHYTSQYWQNKITFLGGTCLDVENIFNAFLKFKNMFLLRFVLFLKCFIIFLCFMFIFYAFVLYHVVFLFLLKHKRTKLQI